MDASGHDVRLRTVNGGVDVDGLSGSVDAERVNRGVNLSEPTGPVRAITVNGGVQITMAMGWKGGDVRAKTVNGGVHEEGHKRLTARLKSMLNDIGCHSLVPCNFFIGQRIPLAGVAHQNGTIRFGDDPQTSALDRNCRAHDVDNLYVVDASFFPSSSAVNPALTIIGNALRVGDHLLKRLA